MMNFENFLEYKAKRQNEKRNKERKKHFKNHTERERQIIKKGEK